MTIILSTDQSRILLHLLHRLLFSGDKREMKSSERTILTDILKNLTESGVR